MPLPWPGVPHGNAFAVAHGDGIVLFDTGIGGPGGTRQLDFALAGAGLSLADVRLLVCTHAHADHYGLASEVVEAAGCELWMHPAWEHILGMTEDPEASLQARVEVARQSGVPPEALAQYEESRKDAPPTITRSNPIATSSPASKSRPTSATGRFMRPPATPRPTSFCISPSAT